MPGSITNVAVKTAQNETDPVTSNDTAVATINTDAAADLAVEKTIDRTTAPVGENVIFEVAVVNRGPNDTTGVSVLDLLPPGLTLVTATPSFGAYDASSGIWTIGTLTATASASLTITATVAQPGSQVNNASIASSDVFDPLPLNNSDAASVNAQADADLRVTKMVSSPAPAIGGMATYTVAVTNLGPSDAASTTITDLLPAGLTHVSHTASSGIYDPVSGEWAIAAIPVTGTVMLSIDALVTGTTSLVNTASRTASTPADPNPLNDVSSVTIVPVPISDLQITKQPSAPGVAAGAPLRWTIVVTNGGPSPVTGATVMDTFPAAFTSAAWTCTASAGSACGAASGLGSFTTPVDLLASGTATFVASGVVSPFMTGSISNIGLVTAPAGTTDPDPVNNGVVSTVLVSSIADVQITKVASQAQFAPGGPVSWTITVVNAGPSSAPALTVTDFVPETVTGVTVSCVATGAAACGTNTSSGNTINFTGASLDPGAGNALTFTVAGTLAATATETLVNTAIVAATAGNDAIVANNSSTSTVPLEPTADLQVSKTGPPFVIAGRTAAYVITIVNAGPFDAAGVIVDDPTPTGLTLSSVAGDCTALPCALGAIPLGAARSVTVVFAVPPVYNGPKPIVNTATVTSSSPDPVPTNNTASATTELRLSRTGCDVNGDGLDEIVTGAGPGGDPHVVVRSLAGGTATILASFYAYELGLGGGVYVACGDVNGDGHADVITGAGAGGGPHVRAFSIVPGGILEIASFWAYDPAFTGGVQVAAGDVNGDGAADIITGAGPGGGPHVRAFSVSAGAPAELAGFFAYDPAFAGGLSVAAGDVTGDGLAEIITGTTREGGPVRVFKVGGPADITELTNFFAYFPEFLGPVRVAAADIDGDGVADIITGAGPGGGPHVRAFSLAGSSIAELASFYAYDPLYCDIAGVVDPLVCDGVYVAGGDVDGDGRAEIITGTNRFWRSGSCLHNRTCGDFRAHQLLRLLSCVSWARSVWRLRAPTLSPSGAASAGV